MERNTIGNTVDMEEGTKGRILSSRQAATILVIHDFS